MVTSCFLPLAYFVTTRLWQPGSWAQVSNAMRTLQGWQGPELKDSRSENTMQQLRRKREQYLKETLALWSLSAELTMLSTFLGMNYFSFGTLAQLPCFVTLGLGNWMFREFMKAEVELTQTRMRFFTAAMSLAHVAMVPAVPLEAVPAVYASRILTCISTTESSLAIWMNVALAPLFVAVQLSMIQDTNTAYIHQLVWRVINEMAAVGVIFAAISTLNSKEYQLEVAAIQLEAKVEEVEEAERSGAAAQRLLSVTCDSFLRLTHDLKILQPSASLSDLLMCDFGTSGKRSLEGVSFTRYVVPQEQQRLEDFLSESSKGSTPARSLHLQLKDSSGIPFNAELFHVSVPSLTSEQPEHLIGLNQEVRERTYQHETLSENPAQLAAGLNAGLPRPSLPMSDMRQMLDSKINFGNIGQRRAEGEASATRSSTKSSRTQDVVELRMLEKVDCLLTVNTDEDDFAIKTVQLSFRDADESTRDEVPYFLEWVKPMYRDSVQNWIQAHVNAHFSGLPTTEHPLRGTKLFSPFSSADTMLSGLMEVCEIEEVDDESVENLSSAGSGSGSNYETTMQVRLQMRNLFVH